MGKRKKSTRKAGAAATAAKNRVKPLDKSFKCLFCLHPGTIVVRMDSKARVGRLDCSNCGQTYETPVTHLSREIDVYTDWLDAADEAKKDARKRRRDDEVVGDEDFDERRPAARPRPDDDLDDDLPNVVGAY